jgi:hypothetical protein
LIDVGVELTGGKVKKRERARRVEVFTPPTHMAERQRVF